MNAVKATFESLRKQGRKAFMPYITAGDPSIAATKSIFLSLEKAGADLIELGIPFSDPLADGPTIQRAVQRSLKAGCTVKKVLKLAKELSSQSRVPFVFMTYFNIILNYGLERFVKDAKASGASGLIVPDLSFEESGELVSIADKEDFSVVQFAAPTTPFERFKILAKRTRGFLYYVSLTGVTGTRDTMGSEVLREIKKLRKTTSTPVCVGFGISNAEQAKAVSKVSDGVIVGSAIIKIIEKNIGNRKKMLSQIEAFAGKIAKAVHGES